MQDNEPLMRSLAKVSVIPARLLSECLPLQMLPFPPSLQLIRVNSPDLVLFVGEALVGNEAVDQLNKFNRALTDHADDQNPRIIDGILLTKFDTIDDKV